MAFEARNIASCVDHLQAINKKMGKLLSSFLNTLVESKIPKRVWMSYVQGFQGWAAGEVVDGEYIEYDGLSGNQSMFFQVTDSFLGIELYLKEKDRQRYIPMSQRMVVDSFLKYSFRKEAERKGITEVEQQMLNICKQLKVFRAAHRGRAGRYLKVDAPERFMMTAGKSVLEGKFDDGCKGALAFLDNFLLQRLKQTV